MEIVELPNSVSTLTELRAQLKKKMYKTVDTEIKTFTHIITIY